MTDFPAWPAPYHQFVCRGTGGILPEEKNEGRFLPLMMRRTMSLAVPLENGDPNGEQQQARHVAQS